MGWFGIGIWQPFPLAVVDTGCGLQSQAAIGKRGKDYGCFYVVGLGNPEHPWLIHPAM